MPGAAIVTLGHRAFAPTTKSFVVTMPAIGCDHRGGWCLHDVLVAHRPHDPTTFDLAHDYSDPTGRPLTDE